LQFLRPHQTANGCVCEGPAGVFICPECIDLCYNIVKQERRRTQGADAMFDEVPKPRKIKEFLDQYVIGQEKAKRGLAVAVHSKNRIF
jgi:ATP-dependent Clp protease ATP-binding subunit ClpX